MDELSNLANQLGAAGGAGDPTAVIGNLAGALQAEGGLDGLVSKLRAGGLGDAVDSWTATGPNQTVDPSRLGAALGPDTVSRLSSGSGLDIGALLPMLAALLPQIIDMLTPDGATPAGGLGSGMPDLGGLLGGVLGGATGSSGGGSGGLDDLLGGLGGILGGSKGR